jgi:hypothetical protein
MYSFIYLLYSTYHPSNDDTNAASRLYSPDNTIGMKHKQGCLILEWPWDL